MRIYDRSSKEWYVRITKDELAKAPQEIQDWVNSQVPYLASSINTAPYRLDHVSDIPEEEVLDNIAKLKKQRQIIRTTDIGNRWLDAKEKEYNLYIGLETKKRTESLRANAHTPSAKLRDVVAYQYHKSLENTWSKANQGTQYKFFLDEDLWTMKVETKGSRSDVYACDLLDTGNHYEFLWSKNGTRIEDQEMLDLAEILRTLVF